MIDVDALVDQIRRGDRRSLARAMSLVDGGGADARALEDLLRRTTGPVPWWGITGPPGVGKSTLIDALLTGLRQANRRVGVVAVDPTSPRSNGALLGDRVRMMRHAVDHDVFIRSLATHGREGGLSDATIHCARLLELAGYDPVLIETVGVGQNEVDVAAVADICVVVLGPGYGDDIQLIKAGLLEAADLVVVNKCDLPEGRRLLAEVHAELARAPSSQPTDPFGRALPREDADNGGAASFHNLPNPTQASASEPTPTNVSGSDLVPKGRKLVAQGVSPGAGPPAQTPSPVGAAETPAPTTGIEVIGIEAKSGRGVDDLLDTLLKLDRAARDPERQQRCRQRRTLDEIKRSAMALHEQALQRELTSPQAEDLLRKAERGDLPLDLVVARLAAAALADVTKGAASP